MKLLIISHAYVERDNHKKLECISKYNDLDLAVVYPKSWKTWHGEDKVQGFDLESQGSYKEFAIDVFFPGNGGKYFYNPLNLLKVIRRFQPDFIQLEEEPWTPVALEIILMKLMSKFRLIFFSWENIDLKLGFIRSLIERLSFKNSCAAIAGNNGVLLRLFKRGFSRRIFVLPQLGVDTRVFYPRDKTRVRESLGVKGDSLVVGFVGRLVEEKGLKTLTDAFAKLATPEKTLVLVTSLPSKTPFIEDVLKNSPDSSKLTIFNGVSHRDLPNYFSCFDIFVLPSLTTPTWKEQFGRTLIEAMACGVSVVGSSSGAIPEVIGPAGLVFKEGNVDSLYECLEVLSKDRQKGEELSCKGLERIQRSFTFDNIASQTVEFYSSL